MIPMTAGEALCEDYELQVEGRPVPVYACRVSAVPFNQVWPGYQRPLDQTEVAGFACWDMTGPVEVAVQSRREVKSVVVRPASLAIRPRVEGNRVVFTLARPAPVVVEVNGPHHALHLLASPPEKDVPAPDAPGASASVGVRCTRLGISLQPLSPPIEAASSMGSRLRRKLVLAFATTLRRLWPIAGGGFWSGPWFDARD